MVTVSCSDCGAIFDREPQETWKRLCLECWRYKKEASGGIRYQSGRVDLEAQLLRAQLDAAQKEVAELKRGRVLPLDMLKRLRILVHPDKHGGSAVAHEMSVYINAEIARLSGRT